MCGAWRPYLVTSRAQGATAAPAHCRRRRHRGRFGGHWRRSVVDDRRTRRRWRFALCRGGKLFRHFRRVGAALANRGYPGDGGDQRALTRRFANPVVQLRQYAGGRLLRECDAGRRTGRAGGRRRDLSVHARGGFARREPGRAVSLVGAPVHSPDRLSHDRRGADGFAACRACYRHRRFSADTTSINNHISPIAVIFRWILICYAALRDVRNSLIRSSVFTMFSVELAYDTRT